MKNRKKSLISIAIFTAVFIAMLIIGIPFLQADDLLKPDYTSKSHDYTAINDQNMGNYCYYGTHILFHFDVTFAPINYAVLNIPAYDVDESDGEVDEVYFIEANGTEHYLGHLTGTDDAVVTTSFILDPAWVQVGTSRVRIEPDIAQEEWAVGIESAQLVTSEYNIIRTREMTCFLAEITEDNMFRLVFIYPYGDNNWVRIYDMGGNMVYEVDMPYDNPIIIVDLPDGTYTVKTFHDQPEPLQTFVIGKP